MKITSVTILVWICVLGLGVTPHLAAAQNTHPRAQEVNALIQQLGASKFADREYAARRLTELGGAALIALRAAAKSKNPEIRLRALELLPELEAKAGTWAAKENQRTAAKRLNVPIKKELDLGAGVKIKVTLVPNGEFDMGIKQRYSTRTMPVHTVKLAKPFYIGTFEITQAQYEQVMKVNPSYERGNDLPVAQVPWNSAREFCAKLSKQSGLHVRLPTEAEWEFACRAETRTIFYSGNSEDDLAQISWYRGNSDGKLHPVGKRKPNAFGLHDMLGNVWEFCEDDWYPSYDGAPKDGSAWVGKPRGAMRVMRGGASRMGEQITTSFHRTGCGGIVENDSLTGFRVVVEAADEDKPAESSGDTTK